MAQHKTADDLNREANQIIGKIAIFGFDEDIMEDIRTLQDEVAQKTAETPEDIRTHGRAWVRLNCSMHDLNQMVWLDRMRWV